MNNLNFAFYLLSYCLILSCGSGRDKDKIFEEKDSVLDKNVIINNSSYHQSKIFSEYSAINSTKFDFVKMDDSITYNNRIIYRYMLVNNIDKFDFIDGYWGVSSDTVLLVSYDNYKNGCIISMPFVILNNRNSFNYQAPDCFKPKKPVLGKQSVNIQIVKREYDFQYKDTIYIIKHIAYTTSAQDILTPIRIISFSIKRGIVDYNIKNPESIVCFPY